MVIHALLSLLLMQQLPDDRTLPKFDVASIKPVPQMARTSVDSILLPGGRLKVTGMSVGQLVQGAFRLPASRVVGPSMMFYDGYNIDAISPENDAGSKAKGTWLGHEFSQKSLLRLRELLLARFHLKYHFEMRQASFYELTLVRRNGGLAEKPFDQTFPLRCLRNRITSQGRPMSELAYKLGQFYLKTEVFDKTGLTGNYAYDFEFEPVDGPISAIDKPVPTLVEAVKEIGLRLIAKKGKVQFLVVDSFDKPTEN